MTEYEIADLAASKIMQTQGVFSIIQTQLSFYHDGIELFMTILFAFLAAAYFVGARMDKVQMWIFTVLYTVWQVWTIGSTTVRGAVAGLAFDRLFELADADRPAIAASSEYLRGSMTFLLIMALLASLYFMWHVRRQKAE